MDCCDAGPDAESNALVQTSIRSRIGSTRGEAPRAWDHRRVTRPTSPRAGFRSLQIGASNPPGTALAALSPSPLHQQNRGAADGMGHEM